ncbi:PUS5-like protein [Saccharomyces kudriavzevii IFO 1802]|uniref:21S rRNA pseudouridine(2819) synthase n=1 Tax=Saccharomyces kudriavzevii (strain ATCC MYA-4449 / AS 2.2408 / CBS 8840 / NBRC 1802 / NCYC 2889) TaxID=226230 RepID=J5PL18_SACK1|nr:PUS5-like protein [Saccharomyces kudriavzevii IFO 1802]
MSLKRQISIIFENAHYFIVNKPPGTPSQPPDSRTWKRTHPDLDPTPLLENFKTLYSSDKQVESCRTVHRIDHCVTGGMLIAKTKDASAKFSRFLRKGGNNGYKLQRKYVAIVEQPSRLNETSNSDINYGPQYNSLISHDGKQITKFKKVDDQCIILQLVTGKKHQIRYHLSQILNQPILNDQKYGSTAKLPRAFKNQIALHSACITTKIGLQTKWHLIPMKYNNTGELWPRKYVSEEGEFISSIKDVLMENWD